MQPVVVGRYLVGPRRCGTTRGVPIAAVGGDLLANMPTKDPGERTVQSDDSLICLPTCSRQRPSRLIR